MSWQTLQAQELRKAGRYFVAEITKSFKVTDGGSLEVSDIRGSVTVNSWKKKEVFIREIKKMDVFTREEAETILSKSKSSYRQTGNSIVVAGEYYRRDWIKSEFEISLPRSFNVDVGTRAGDLKITAIDGSIDLKTSGGEITLEDLGGDIDAKTSGGDVTVVNARGRTNLKTSGGELDLEEIHGPLMARTSGGNVVLRGASDAVELKTSGGDMEIVDVKGGVDAHTSGGDVELSNVSGGADISTSGGDIQFENVSGALDASTSGGDIVGRTIIGNAMVTTAGGSIDLRDVQGGAAAKTAGGDIAVEITLQDFSKRHNIDLRTAGGEITLFIPEKLPARVRAEIEVSSRWDSYNIYSDFPLTSSQEAEEGRRRHRRQRYITSEGEINGGGDLIELFTTNGDIRIKKLVR